MSTHVNTDNFVRAETDRMFRDIQLSAGGINRFRHNREPAPIEEQTVIRLNRDTLYSFAIVDATNGFALTLPDTQGRYLSAMVVNNDHYVTTILHDAGTHQVRTETIGTAYALVAVRILVDPTDADDVAVVAALQDQIVLEAGSSHPFESPEYDADSLDNTRSALLALAAELRGFDRTFGNRWDVDPIRHLIGTAAGWGGLPTSEAAYVGVNPKIDGDAQITMRDVPADAFWSISVYNAEGFFEKNPYDSYTINSITATPEADGSVIVRFVTGEPVLPNSIPVPKGWNFLVRAYRPRVTFLDGTWTLPEVQPVAEPAV